MGGSRRDAEGFALRAVQAGWQTVACDLPEGLLPWDCVPYLRDLVARMRQRWPVLGLRATSIGAWLSLVALRDVPLTLALFQSPLLDMAGMIEQMMRQVGVSRERLADRGAIRTDAGVLSWRYLAYAEANCVAAWEVPTWIIVGERDELISRKSVEDFCSRFGADLTVVPGGAHWLHAPGEVDAVAQWERLRLQQGPRARWQALPAE
ncbi:alpha/beta fold hydrolase [Actinomyces qiguomingii]|uniref:alpha/beta fold hydrolase n=1 Tax=Actinomyces qiguomingii TaxID=2057800 RepID=UPI000CA0326B|nr:alpha/beta hydrolase [Actinomyces qiguomingii]